MNYELGRTKTANIEDPTFNGNSNAKRVPSLQLPTSSARFPPRVRPAALKLFVIGWLLLIIALAEVRDRETRSLPQARDEGACAPQSKQRLTHPPLQRAHSWHHNLLRWSYGASGAAYDGRMMVDCWETKHGKRWILQRSLLYGCADA